MIWLGSYCTVTVRCLSSPLYSSLVPPFYPNRLFLCALYSPITQYDAAEDEEEDCETIQTTSDDAGRTGAARVRLEPFPPYSPVLLSYSITLIARS
jgi:hypothetical protein